MWRTSARASHHRATRLSSSKEDDVGSRRLEVLTDDRAVDQGGELLGAVPEVVADRRKCQHDVQVLPDKLDEVLPAVFPVGHEPLRLDLVGHIIHLVRVETGRRLQI